MERERKRGIFRLLDTVVPKVDPEDFLVTCANTFSVCFKFA